MKSIRLSIIGLLLFQSSLFAQAIKLSNNKIEISYDDVTINSTSELKTIETPGLPELPYFSFIILGKPTNLKVDLTIKSDFAFKDGEIKPAQPKPCRCNRVEKLSYTEDKSIYTKNEFWPKQNYTLEYLGDYQGKPLSRLTYYPSRYNPITKESQTLKKVEFNLASKDNSPLRTYDKFDDLLIVQDRKYLIVTPNKFVNALNGFIAWKKKLGFSVDVVTLEEIGTEAPVIQSYLKKRFLNSTTKFSFLLLVGHEGIFPTYYEMTTNDRNTPSDLKYLLYGGDDDYIPDVFYGRMVIDNDEDILHQTQKIINYEKGIFSNPSNVKKAMGIASNEGIKPSDVDYLLDIEKPFVDNRNFTFTNLFQGNEDANVKNINNQFSSGISWFTCIGHGSGFSWPSLTDAEYDISKIKEMKFTNLNPIIIDVACQNGRFKYGSNLGERMMNETDDEGNPLGAVAYYGGSVDISWDPPAIMAKGITQSYIDKNLTFLGQTLLAGQLYLLNNFNSIRAVRDNFTWYHLQGDPSLQIRTKLAHKINLSKAGDQIKLTNDFNMTTGPVNVTFSDDQLENFITVPTIPDQNGFETVTIPLNSDQVYISSPNFEFTEQKIMEED
ncbi:MAG: C25 family cysteine peptidase [Bacteriovoracaceae bacterium]